MNHAPARITCRFPGAGYPVCHGVPNIPARLGISPKDVRIRVISGPEMDPARVPTNSVPLRCIHEGGREVIEFVVDFTNRHTRVDVSYTSPWQSLDDGRKIFFYILTSGAFWRGSIGSLVVSEQGRRAQRVRRLWPCQIPRSRVEPDFDLVYQLSLSRIKKPK